LDINLLVLFGSFTVQSIHFSYIKQNVFGMVVPLGYAIGNQNVPRRVWHTSHCEQLLLSYSKHIFIYIEPLCMQKRHIWSLQSARKIVLY